jgi:hypothetical protein
MSCLSDEIRSDQAGTFAAKTATRHVTAPHDSKLISHMHKYCCYYYSDTRTTFSLFSCSQQPGPQPVGKVKQECTGPPSQSAPAGKLQWAKRDDSPVSGLTLFSCMSSLLTLHSLTLASLAPSSCRSLGSHSFDSRPPVYWFYSRTPLTLTVYFTISF